MSFVQNSQQNVPNESATLHSVGREYFARLLENIKLMLSYTEENGIVIPDDLKEKISALFFGPLPSANLAAKTTDTPADSNSSDKTP